MTYTIKDFTDLFERDRTNKQKNKKNKRTKKKFISRNARRKNEIYASMMVYYEKTFEEVDV